jgi:hypothetical protein
MAKRRRKKHTAQDIIKNMGLFWDSDKVRWKGNRRVGSKCLTGTRATAKRSGNVDFWNQTGIYALYQQDYHLVYVGQAGLTDQSCMGSRLKTHLSDTLAGRWKLFSWFGLQAVRGDNTLGMRGRVKLTQRAHLADVLEGIVIEVAEPPMNNQRGRFGHKVERYLQVDQGPKPQLEADNKLEGKLQKLERLIKKATS